jgi:hypothetical protein
MSGLYLYIILYSRVCEYRKKKLIKLIFSNICLVQN